MKQNAIITIKSIRYSSLNLRLTNRSTWRSQNTRIAKHVITALDDRFSWTISAQVEKVEEHAAALDRCICKPVVFHTASRRLWAPPAAFMRAAFEQWKRLYWNIVMVVRDASMRCPLFSRVAGFSMFACLSGSIDPSTPYVPQDITIDVVS